MYTNKTATILRSNAVVTRPVHVVLLDVAEEFRRHLINDGHTIVGLLPVSTFFTDDDDMPGGDTDGRP